VGQRRAHSERVAGGKSTTMGDLLSVLAGRRQAKEKEKEREKAA